MSKCRDMSSLELALKVDGLVQLVDAQATEGEAGEMAHKNAGQPVEPHSLLCRHGRSLVLQLVVCTPCQAQSDPTDYRMAEPPFERLGMLGA